MMGSTVGMALAALNRNKFRALLTALGIVIGVASVTTMVTLGRSATQEVTAQMAKLGTRLLVVTPSLEEGEASNRVPPPLRNEQYLALRRALAGTALVAGTSSSQSFAIRGSHNTASTVLGTSNEFLDIRGAQLASGRRFLSRELQAQAPACIVGKTVRRKLFEQTPAIGHSIRVGAISCPVIGVLESRGGTAAGTDQDDLILMPMLLHQRRIAGRKEVQAILVSVDASDSVDKVRQRIEQVLAPMRRMTEGRPKNFTVHDMEEAGEALRAATRALTGLLGAIASVSLLVGGIGIMNIMLVSVTERTREIGLRLAIGAAGREVLMQFLVESTLLSLFGGALGVAVGLLGAYGTTRALEMPFALTWSVVALAFGFSAAVGIVFGFLPARRAARMSPVAALAFE